MGTRSRRRSGLESAGATRSAIVLVLMIALLISSLTPAACSTGESTPVSDVTTSSSPPSVTASPPSVSSTLETTVTATSVTTPEPQGAGDGASPATAVAEAVASSVVDVAAADAQGRQLGIGSGVIYSEDGVIVTNDHVVVAGGDQPAPQLTVTIATGEALPAQVVGMDPISDLAVLRVDRDGLPAAEFLEDLSQLKVGDYAIAIGTPLGLEGTVTLGIISAFKREIMVPGTPGATDYIQTDAAISPGNSGGALLDARGRVIGINAAGLQPQSGAQNIGFAIPADLVVFVVEQILRQGEVRYGYMGVQSSPLTPDIREQLGLGSDVQGVVIVTVEPGSPAAVAGLQQGDVVTAIGGQNVSSSGSLFSVLRRTPPGEQAELSIVRGGRELTLVITMGERPSL